MKKTDIIAKDFSQYIAGRDMIEIACGDADFSFSAARYAKKVLATDISSERIGKRTEKLPENVGFVEADASRLDIKRDSFGLVVFYNCLAHLKNVLEDAAHEAARIASAGGHVIFVSSWKIDMPYFTDITDIAKKIETLSLKDTADLKEYSALIYEKFPD